MEEISLKQQRRMLKASLSTNRGKLAAGGWYPLCAYCGKPMKYGYDMHEAILTRGDIRGNPELSPLIMVKYNCCLVCHGKCHIESATRDGRRKMIMYLISWEGYNNIINWLESIPTISGQAMNAIRLVTEVNNEL